MTNEENFDEEIKKVLDSWDDDSFGVEYAKFLKADLVDSALYDDKVDVLYCKPDYDSICNYINQWNKQRKRIDIKRIIRCIDTPYTEDTIEIDGNLCLDMGARLYNSVKSAYGAKMDYIKILKISNPNDKFDVHYYTSRYKLEKQEKIVPPKKTKK